MATDDEGEEEENINSADERVEIIVPLDVWERVLERGIDSGLYEYTHVAQLCNTVKFKDAEPRIWYRLLTRDFLNKEDVSPNLAKEEYKRLILLERKIDNLREQQSLLDEWDVNAKVVGKAYFSANIRLSEYEEAASYYKGKEVEKFGTKIYHRPWLTDIVKVPESIAGPGSAGLKKVVEFFKKRHGEALTKRSELYYLVLEANSDLQDYLAAEDETCQTEPDTEWKNQPAELPSAEGEAENDVEDASEAEDETCQTENLMQPDTEWKNQPAELPSAEGEAKNDDHYATEAEAEKDFNDDITGN